MSDLLPKEREGFSLWLSAETRKQLILRLKDIVKQLMPYVHRKELQYLTETHIEVQRLCEVLELILFHGLKISEFQGQVVFWGLLERLEVITPPCIPLRNSVGAIACIGTLRTPLGKARGWIRQSLNSQSLEESVQFMLSQTHNWVSKFYYPDALLCQKEEGSMLVAVIRSLKIFCFNLTIDNDALNSPSPSLIRLIQVQTALSPTSTASPSSMKSPSGRGSAPGSVRTPNTSSNAGGGVGSFDSIMKSFETGLDKILNHVDQLLNSSLDSPDQQSLDTPSASSSHSSKKLTSLFGSSLRDLVLDDQRCAHANLNAELGIPTMIIKLIQYIHHNAQTPNLFRQRVTVTAIEELKRSLEAEKGIPATCNIATVSFVLIQWLNQLPEPLLGFDHYAAILACAEVEDIRHRTRNLSLLLAETSWYNKPLLLMTLSLLAHCLLPENTSHNQLNHIAVAVLCTPFLLRPPYDKPVAYLSQEEIDRLQMAATAAGSHLIEFLVQHQTEVCEVVREELNMKQVILSHKCNRVRQLQETLALSFDISDVGSFDADRLQLLYHLWHLLAPVEKSLSFNHTSSSGATTPPPHSIGEGEGVVTSVPLMSMEEILAHPRWVVCGLLLTSDKSSSLPLTEFNSPLGLLAIQCFVAFLKKYDVRAVNILVDFQLNRQGFCRLAQVILRLTHFTADVLYLLPPSSSVTSSSSSGIRSIAPIQYISKTLAWQLLGDDAAFQDLFDISLLCFDEAWRNVTERIGELASTETLSQALFRTRAMLWDIMVKKPTTTSQVWETWTNLKLAEEEKLFQRMLLTSSNSKTVHHHATTTSTPSNTASPMASSGHSYILNHGKVKTLTSPSNAATSNTSNKPPSLPPPPQTTNSSQRNARKGSDVTNSSDEDDDDFNDFDNPDDNLPLNQRQRQSNNTASSTPSSTSSYTSVAASTLSSLFSSFQPLSSSQTQSNQNRGNFGRALDTSSSDDDDDDNDVITAKGSKTAPIPTTNNNNNNSNSNNSNNNTTNKIFTIEEGEGFLNIHQNDNNNNLNTSTSSNTTKGGVRGSLRDVEVNDSTVVGRGGVVIGGGSVEVVPSLNTMSMAMRHYEQTGEMNEYMNSALTAEMMRREVVSVTQKTSMGITTNIFGGSKILSMSQILQLEAVLPATHQCYDWKLLYRLSLHGASLATLLHKAQGHSNTLLVVQDSRGAIFGALVTDSMKVAERDKYYGNGTMGVWSFNNPNGALRYYNWSFKNSYFMITSKECIAFGGGGHFALYLDSDLNHGSSGPCQTFSSPCLASEEEFHCTSCELFSFQATTGSSATSTTNNTSSTSSH